MKKLSFLILLLGIAAFSFSQGFGTSGLTPGQSSGNPMGTNSSTYFITHSSSQTIESGVSVACNLSGFHRDNSYFRVFDLAGDFGINESITISSVDFGIETATAGTGMGGVQPATVNIYTLSGSFIWAHLTLIATQAVSVPDQTLTMFNLPIVATIPAGAVLVVEVFTPDGNPDGSKFFIGANTLTQTDPSYIAASDCGASEPTDITALGFPNDHIVINVNADPANNPVPVSNWALIFGILLITVFMAVRYKRTLV